MNRRERRERENERKARREMESGGEVGREAEGVWYKSKYQLWWVCTCN